MEQEGKKENRKGGRKEKEKAVGRHGNSESTTVDSSAFNSFIQLIQAIIGLDGPGTIQPSAKLTC